MQKALAIYKIIQRLDPYNEEAVNKSKELIIELEISKKRGAPFSYQETAKETESGVAAGVITSPEVEVGKEEIKEVEVKPLLFSSLPDEAVKSLMNSVIPKVFPQGAVIIREGDSGDSIFLLESGHAKVVAHFFDKEIELAVLSAGDLFGEVAFLTGRPRTASVIALDNLTAREFHKTILEKIIHEHPEILKMLDDFYQCRVQDTLQKVKSTIKKEGASS
jgi:CRP-like cAMP-binding protein